MQERPSRAQIRHDVIAGTRPALYLALGLGVVTGGSVTVVMVIATLLIASAGGIAVDTGSGLMQLVGVSIGFWLGVSVGVILGITVGFRSWVAFYPAYERRAVAAEQRAAIDEVESLLRHPHATED